MRVQIFEHSIKVNTGLIKEEKSIIRDQLGQYAEKELEDFNLELRFPDSFTGQVMEKMYSIHYGETRTYGEIAEKLDTSPIAVGHACSRNTVPIIIPCHRVLGKNSVGGYRYGRELKEKLLDFES